MKGGTIGPPLLCAVFMCTLLIVGKRASNGSSSFAFNTHLRCMSTVVEFYDINSTFL